MSIKDILDVVIQLGPVGLIYMFGFFVALITKVIVLGWQYDEVKKERDDLFDIVLFSIGAADKATETLVTRRRQRGS